MNDKLTNEALRLMCKKYQDEHVKSPSRLSDYQFNYLMFSDLDVKSKLAIKIIENDDYLGLLVDELESLGFVTKGSGGFFLTKSGFEAGTENIAQKCLKFLNLNPGLAIVISFVSLAVSIGALFISSIKS